jgi:nonribosomal peptide synthetase MxcG
MSNSQTYSSIEVRDLVLNLYQEVLGATEVSAQDDFFDHGGDSVKGVALLHRLRDITGVRLAIATLFIRRTPEELSEEVTAALAG